MWTTLYWMEKRLLLWATEHPPHGRKLTPLSVRTEADARNAISRYMHDSWNHELLRQFLRHDLRMELGPADEPQLTEALVDLLVRRRVLVAEAKVRLSFPPPREVVVVPPPPEPAKTTTWIEIQVVWDHDGKGIGDLEFELEKPDQEREKVTTNGQGVIRVEGLARGACLLSAALGEAQVDNAARILGWGDEEVGEGAGEGVDGVKHVVQVERHRVRSGETLESIAEDAGMSWRALAKFNWGTDEKKEVKKRLAEQVGAWVEDPERDAFDDGDEPGVLFVPRPFEARGLATSRRHVLRIAPMDLEDQFTFST